MDGYVLMRYGLDESGNEISESALCASKSEQKLQKKLDKIVLIESRSEDIRYIHNYRNQVVIEYSIDYDNNGEYGVRYIIEYLEIL